MFIKQNLLFVKGKERIRGEIGKGKKIGFRNEAKRNHKLRVNKEKPVNSSKDEELRKTSGLSTECLKGFRNQVLGHLNLGCKVGKKQN